MAREKVGVGVGRRAFLEVGWPWKLGGGGCGEYPEVLNCTPNILQHCVVLNNRGERESVI